MPGPLDIQEFVILARCGGPFLAVVGVKVGRCRRAATVLLPIDVIVEHGHRPVAFVGHGDLAGFAERHGPVAVVRAAEGAVAHHQRIQVALVPVPHAEEIAQRHIHAGRLFAVVVDAQPHQAGPGKFVVGHRKPDVAHHAGTL